jgi:hypothetical protein
MGGLEQPTDDQTWMWTNALIGSGVAWIVVPN